MADGAFSPLGSRNSAIGPNSNTGQNLHRTSTLTAPIIDFCTVVLDSEAAKKFVAKKHLTEILRDLFSTESRIAVGPLMDRPFNFYERSATMIDESSTICGKIGVALDGRIQISLTGQGCQHVADWNRAADMIEAIDGRLSRVDIAVDDLTGETFSVDMFRDLYVQGDFTTNGRPPQGHYIDDLGNKKGCSMYIGQKGHKQLNVYEKGKQLGDPNSDHTRCELRLYSKRYELPVDALRNPGKYFGSAYPLLVAFVVGECERLQLKEVMVNASAKAMVKFLRNQAGTALQLVMDALGDDAVEFIVEHVARSGRPGRFKSFTGDLPLFLRNELLSDP